MEEEQDGHIRMPSDNIHLKVQGVSIFYKISILLLAKRVLKAPSSVDIKDMHKI